MEMRRTLREALPQGKKEGVVINFKEMNDYIKRCEENKLDKTCRIELKKIGINFVDED